MKYPVATAIFAAVIGLVALGPLGAVLAIMIWAAIYWKR